MGINIQNLSFSYNGKKGNKILENINVEIKSTGEIVAILGHTGSGKSTLVQMMNALLLTQEGVVNVFGQKINEKNNGNLKNVRKKVGLVFQFPEYQLFEETILKDVMFGPKNFGKTKEEAEELAKKSLLKVGITEDLFEKSPFELSGGQKRRVAIAGIIASEPQILVLDEPTVGLDTQGKKELMELLLDINNENEKSIILITHDMNVVGDYARRVIVLDEGKVVYDGPKQNLFENSEFVLKHNLDLPQSAKLALYLKEKGLINFDELPLNKTELLKIIMGGDYYE